MNRPTISMAMIIKNEMRNLPTLLQAVEGCFDAIHITDTGSTDGSVEWLVQHGMHVAKCPVYIHKFKWIDDFSAARNFSFSHVDTDYVYWQDGDDILDNKESFKIWRDHAMGLADYWLANYHYSLDAQGKPNCTFLRERVFNMKFQPKWEYFVHEGVKPIAGAKTDIAHVWTIKHVRTHQDHLSDKGRNLQLLEKNKANLDTRMQWYLGKEYYDNGRFDQALPVLVDVITKEDLEAHDRILAVQFAAYSAMALANQLKPEYQAEKLMLARQLAQQGLNLDPKRAEFYCLIGEVYILQQDLLAALPYFCAAENCLTPESMGFTPMNAIFSFRSCYEDHPKIQKVKIFMHLGRIEEALKEAQACVDKYPTDEAKTLLADIQKVAPIFTLQGKKIKTDDIVFSCPPYAAYPFDEEIYKTKPLGGSETALVQMARLLKEKTGRAVKVFNVRDQALTAPSGVEYISNQTLNEYMSKHEPAVHIAWRHNIKLTNAPTYLWCHDLKAPNAEMMHNFDHFLCLSEFHKNYVMATQGIPKEKIIVTDNGLDPQKFQFERKPKNKNKLVWMSSPDRGLDRAMLVCDEVRKTYPDIELHVYYGIENLYKYGLQDLADKLKLMMSERPYVKYHGFTEQSKMYHEVSDAVVWVHPCNFIETNCITAKEMLALGIFPVTRRLGGLQDTLKKAEKEGMAVMLNHDCVTREEIHAYAHEVFEVLKYEKWARVSLDPKTVSWERVAESWIKFLALREENIAAV